MAGEVRIAVASNFLSAAQGLSETFQTNTGHRVIISNASTGKLYAQILHGAPYDIFLAANSREPKRLEEQGLVSVGNRFTYARGQLVLLSLHAQRALTPSDLKTANRVALANPKLAPYGLAAEQLMQAEHIPQTATRIVAENVAQTFLYVITGNVPMGFVALSQVKAHFGAELPKGIWIPPIDSYTPIEQQAVLLRQAEKNPAALAFIRYLKSAAVTEQIISYGYVK